MDGWVRAGSLRHNRIKNYYVSGCWIVERGIKDDIDLPFNLESALKKNGVVPQDAYLVAWFYEINKHGYTLRFMHPSFEEVPPCDDIPTVGV